MRRQTMTHDKIIALTQLVLHGFYGRKIEHLHQYMSDDFMWIGAFHFQVTTSKAQFLQVIQSEMDAIPFLIQQEHYEVLTRDRDTYVLGCQLQLNSPIHEDKFLQMDTRLTVVWKFTANGWQLVHIHGSNAQDVPLFAENSAKTIPTDSFIDYISRATDAIPAPQHMFRLPSGAHYFVNEGEIVYMQADGKNSILYTKNDVVTVSGLLRTHISELSDHFYRIHKSYLINLRYLSAMQRYWATLSTKTKLPISKEKYIPLREHFHNKNAM